MRTCDVREGISLTTATSGSACITLTAPAHPHFCGCGHFYVCAERDCNGGQWDCPACEDRQMAEWLETEQHIHQIGR